jgi:hypothetical protein
MQPGPHAPQRIRFTGDRGAEQREYRVADVLLDHPAVLVDDLPDGSEVVVLHPPNLLRIDVFDDAGEAHHVDEQGTDRAPLLDREVGRVRAGAAAPGAVRGGSVKNAATVDTRAP